MPRWLQTGLMSFAALSVAIIPALAHAASLGPTPQTAAGALPPTPAYRNAAVTQDLTVLTSSPHSRIVDVVVDSPARIAALAAYSAAVDNPKSPLFHHFLSPAALNHAFGPTPGLFRQAQAAMRAAGWHMLAVHGFMAEARVPGRQQHPGLPISPAIWAISGFRPHGILPSSGAGLALPPGRPALSASTSLIGTSFAQAPVALQQTTAPNGDLVSIMSWNPRMTGTVPTGLPVNLFVTVQDPQGNWLPIAQIGALSDPQQSLVSYGAQAMPQSSHTLWQIPLAAWRPIASGDTLSLAVTLANGSSLNASFPLPAFTGTATALSPLTAQQMNALSGLNTLPPSPGPIALFSLGAPPSITALSAYLQQNTVSPPPTSVTFHYEDGATPQEAGQSGASAESQLDLEAAAGAAPGAPIAEYVYPLNDAHDPLISYLTDLSQQSTVKIASLSYGFYGEDPSTLTALMDALTAEGLTVVEASGDQGAWNGGADPGPVGLSSLEQIPSVLSVGGLDVAAPATTNAQGATMALTGAPIAKAWGGDYLNGIPVSIAQAYTNRNAASSGGYSTETPVPSWEAGALPATAGGYGVPILAGVAGYPGLSGYLAGQNVVFGGTSLAAPLTAGWLSDAQALLHLSASGLGNMNPLLFQAARMSPSMFTQAQWGADGVYAISANAPGTWNPLTGLGLVNWGSFVEQYHNLVPSATPTVALNTTPSSPTVGQPVTLNASAVNIANPQYQFWVKNPLSGQWHSMGSYTSTSSVSFTPSVPGSWEAEVFVQSETHSVITQATAITVTSSKPMISSLTLSRNVTANLLSPGTSITFQATSTESGGTSRPEYQFWLHGPNNHWQVIQNYSTKSSVSLSHLQAGSYTLAVYAMDATQIAVHQWQDAYYDTTVINVGSSVSLTAPKSGSVGNSLTLTAFASHITRPVYQFWIENPQGQWQSSGNYTPTGTWNFTPSLAGTYHVVVYAKDPYAPATAQYAVRATTNIPVN